MASAASRLERNPTGDELFQGITRRSFDIPVTFRRCATPKLLPRLDLAAVDKSFTKIGSLRELFDCFPPYGRELFIRLGRLHFKLFPLRCSPRCAWSCQAFVYLSRRVRGEYVPHN